MNDSFDEDFDLPPSKTQRKKESLALQDLGEQLTRLSNQQLAKLPLDDALRTAVGEAQKMKANSARKRHIQFIGKLIRQGDSDALLAAWEALQEQSQGSHQLHHLCEHWRDQLIADGSQAEQFMANYPAADRQQLRQLVRNCQASKAKSEEPSKQQVMAARKLFQWLRDTIQQHDQ
ncbi:ribosome biogenesis factor YjgA [Halioxenophilus sp. WMMB6]|uniref:ribosome biogenesis factor YjgA n=1 Tax=Halioxenophilus sp. WMMB6 TaxID=3073815 RepID=UPI00295F1393|nr:ribosome biogenesis factor YjgA [Halioxenophilus sp. WMMB6]